ncbi:hypothetical protein JXI42_06370 [bacterium]|nr:hypothetical protein [bacterium]
MAYNLHLNLLKLGRTICFPRNPNCMQCPINNICQEGQGRIKNEEEDTKRN